jgi:hypothetical protein
LVFPGSLHIPNIIARECHGLNDHVDRDYNR